MVCSVWSGGVYYAVVCCGIVVWGGLVVCGASLVSCVVVLGVMWRCVVEWSVWSGV